LSNASDDSVIPCIRKFQTVSAEALKQFEAIPELAGAVIIPVWKGGVSDSSVGLYVRPTADIMALVVFSAALGNAAPMVANYLLDMIVHQQQQIAAQEQTNGKETIPSR